MKTKVVNVNKEPYDVCIMRPSLFGNPFPIIIDGDRNEVCDKHLNWLLDWILDGREIFIGSTLTRTRSNKTVVENLYKLNGKRLRCCCSPERCHGDNYIAILKVFNLKGER